MYALLLNYAKLRVKCEPLFDEYNKKFGGWRVSVYAFYVLLHVNNQKV